MMSDFGGFMKKKSIGEILKTARELRNWTLIDLQRMTTIPANQLQALEYNDFESLAESNDVRYLLATYSEALDLESDVLLEAYDTNTLVKYYAEGEEELGTAELSRSYKFRKKNNHSYLPLVYLLLATAIIMVFILATVYSKLQNQTTISRGTSEITRVVDQTTISTTATESSTETPTTTSSTSQAPEQTIELSGSGDKLTATVKKVQYPLDIQLSVTDVTSWISLSGTPWAEGIVLSPDNPTATISIKEPLPSTELVLGVVQGVAIAVGGQKIDTSALTSNTGIITLYFEQ